MEEEVQSSLDSSLRAIQNGLLDDLASNIIRSPSAGYATAGVGRGRGFCGRGRGRGTNSFGASSRYPYVLYIYYDYHIIYGYAEA